jgi:hypothetical protein
MALRTYRQPSVRGNRTNGNGQIGSITRAARIIDQHEHNPLQAATLFGIAAHLSQNGRITGICCRALTPAEKHYDTIDQELLAIVYTIKQCMINVDTHREQHAVQNRVMTSPLF